jgi:spermidine/putrescine transport system substrate-binding protein
MCIPTSSPHPELAREYINFMLDTEIAIANAEYICYASPNKTVAENEEYIEYMNEIHPDAISILYDIDISNMQFFYDLPDEVRDNMNSLWEELKIESTIGTSIFVICGLIVALGVFCLVWRVIVRKKREHCFKKYSAG